MAKQADVKKYDTARNVFGALMLVKYAELSAMHCGPNSILV
jgi:hypothetical protein